MMDINLKRELDSKITSSFLSDSQNMNIVFKMVNMLGNEIKRDEMLKSLHFYVKGGNSIALLENKPFSGDFDFQLSLNKESYENVKNWQENIISIDSKLRQILTDICNQYDEICRQSSNEKFKVENIFDDRIGDYVSDKFSIGHMLIGKNYLKNTYSQIISKINLQKGETRLNISKSEIESQTSNSEVVKPMWYVNYTIPGFILYRIVLRKSYKKGKETEHLKSEIIDISIPRYGSDEVYMSQENIITHFKDVSIYKKEFSGFKVPGWGYHFYENLNLLQEIKLNISGSKHKKEKRINRGTLALNHLLEKNGNSLDNILYSNKIYENDEEAILGLVEAYAYNVDTYHVLNKAMMDNIKSKIKEFYTSELKTTPIRKEQRNLFSNLVEYQTNNNVLNNMIMFKDLEKAVNEVKRLGLVSPEPYFLIYNFDKTKLMDKDEIPVRFLVMNVNSHNYNKIKDEYKKSASIFEFEDQCYIILRVSGGTCYLIMNHTLKSNAISYEQILERTIIQSQRYRLALAYNKIKKEI